MKIVFFGTSEFAVPILKAIAEKTDWEILFVVSEPAKPQGRSGSILKSPVSQYAESAGLKVIEPESLDGLDISAADVAVIVSYGRIIPAKLFNSPKHKTVNMHPSLLPKLRGPSPIQSALLQGLAETGVSLMLIDEKVDHGPILSQKAFPILEADNYESLEKKLADLGAEMLIRDLPRYAIGDIRLQPQDDGEATFTKLIKKEDGRVDWTKSSDEIFNQYRAFFKWPGIFTFFKNRNGQMVRLKLIDVSCHSHENGNPDLDSRLRGNDTSLEPGVILSDDKKNLFVICGSGAIQVKKLQPENSKIQTATEFFNGYGYIIGQKLL